MTRNLSTPPSVHFSRGEFEQRQARARAALVASQLDGLLVSRIEDQYWLSGLDTDGFCIFHLLFLPVEMEMTHLSRTADLANIEYSSLVGDVRVWIDGEHSSKATAVKDMLADGGMEGRRVGIQLDTFGLLPELYLEIKAALDGWCELVDASALIRDLRLVKSPAELAYHRKAGEIVDQMQRVGIAETSVGAFEGDIMGRVWSTAFALGGDPPAHRPPIGNGRSALNMRYTTSRKHVGKNDQVTFELGAGYRHYHAANMFVVLTGPDISSRHVQMHEACVNALQAVQARMRAGNTVGDMYEAHRAAFSEFGYGHAILRACGYTMGATWPPTWMEQPMIVEGSPVVLEANMTFFTHMILVDRASGLTMSLGEQAIVTNGDPEVITHVPRNPVVAR